MTELDPNGFDPHSSGAKLDLGKPQVIRFVLAYFPDALEAVSRVSEFGAAKYVEGGWRTVPDGVTRYTEALGRHLIYEKKGEDLDQDSGLEHAAHLAWNALARLQLMIDARMKNVSEPGECAEAGGREEAVCSSGVVGAAVPLRLWSGASDR